jgi:hypothetical protein
MPITVQFTEEVYRMRATQTTENKKPVEPRMNLDVGKLTIREATELGILSVTALFVASIGGVMGWAAVGHLGGGLIWAWVWILGNAIGLVAFALGGVVCWLTVRSWLRYEDRLQEWHEVSIDAFIGADGMEVSTQHTEWELTTNTPRDVLLVALAIHQRVQAGEGNAHTVRELSGAQWIGGVRLGDVTGAQAERMSRALGQLGLVKDKAPRRAGTWAAGSADDVIARVVGGWSKVKNDTLPVNHQE